MKKKAIAISPADDASLSTALVPADKGAGALDELATAVASFATEYNNLDSSINDLTTELLEQDRKLAKTNSSPPFRSLQRPTRLLQPQLL